MFADAKLQIFLICLARIAVCQQNDSAAAESVFAEDMVHDDIVLMGVDAYASAPAEGPVQKSHGCIMSGFPDRNPVDYVVRRFIRPFSVIYFCVCGVRSGNECHRGKDISAFSAQDHAVSVRDICSDRHFRRIRVVPLVHVSAFPHDCTGIPENLHQCVDVFVCRFSYHMFQR